MHDDPCPCGQLLPYVRCCGPYHQGELALQAPTPEALMRSRYSAFVLDRRDYLLATWHPQSRPGQIEPPEPGLRWLGLEVRVSAMLDETHGTVDFVARCKVGGRAQRLRERSLFEWLDGRWYYLKALDLA